MSSPIPDSPELQMRRHGGKGEAASTLLYLPGLHGDWTLLGPFRDAWSERGDLLEVTYPRRPDWMVEDYAEAILAALRDRGITRCWILGESFSSQVAWQLLSASAAAASPVFEGLILAGGFVRHPWLCGVRLAWFASDTVPSWVIRPACQFYGWLAKQRVPRAEYAAELDDFVARRSTEEDRAAITSRYVLIHENDPGPVARAAQVPVFLLSGAWDPIVPWWLVRPWLQEHCPGYQGSCVFWGAGHNVLLSAPRRCTVQISAWIRAAATRPSAAMAFGDKNRGG